MLRSWASIIRELRGQVDHLFVRLERALARVYRGKHRSRLDFIRMEFGARVKP